MNRQRCLELLNLKQGASKEDIQKAYHVLVKVWHPDRFGHDPALAQKAQEMLKQINEARAVLMKQPFLEASPNSENLKHAPYRTIHKRGLFHDSFIWFLVLIIGCLILFGIGRSAFHGSFYKSSPGNSLQEIG